MKLVTYRVDATGFRDEMAAESAAVIYLNDQPNVVYSIRHYTNIPIPAWYVRIEGHGWLKDDDAI